MRRTFRLILAKTNQYFSPLVIIILFLSFLTRTVGIETPPKYVFDEDFFAFTAQLIAKNDQRTYEWWHGPLTTEMSAYTYRAPAIEWLHPPVSKLVQAVSILLLGDIPLAWRLPSAIAGVCIVLLLMFLTKTLFQSSLAALLVGLVACFEQLLVVQSRVASPDIFVVLLILLTLLAYWKYFHRRTMFWLSVTGICFGLAIATKWTATFLFPGLALFELWHSLQIKPKKNHLSSVLSWLTFCLTVCVMSVVVYIASFGQFFLQGRSLRDFFELHKQIWHYQTSANFEHPGSSYPWQWLLGEKPILYYVDNSAQIPISIITAQPTKVILFVSEFALIAAVVLLILHKNQPGQRWWSTTLLVMSALSLYGPFWFIARPLFIYHFAPILCLLILIAGGQLARVLPDPKT